jgi:hypothetical protein
MSFTEHTTDKVIEPISVSPDLNIERVSGELGLRVVVGKRINWDDYKVMLNESRVYTTAGKESFVGETVYFDYSGGRLSENSWYDLDIIDIEGQMIVYSDRIPALSYPPEGTGVYGYVTSASSGYPIAKAQVYLYRSGVPVNFTETDPTGAYIFFYPEGDYELRVEVNSTLPETFGLLFQTYTGSITVSELRMIKHDVELQPGQIENSTVKGHIYDKNTNAPLANVNVRLTDFRFFQKLLSTNENGYYEFSMPARYLTIICTAEGYKDYIENFNISFNETLTLDILLETLPEPTVTISGYVYDDSNSEALPRINVFVDGAFDTPYTKTSETGYYEIMVIPGSITIFVDTVDYKYYEKTMIVDSNKSYTVDIYLEREVAP